MPIKNELQKLNKNYRNQNEIIKNELNLIISVRCLMHVIQELKIKKIIIKKRNEIEPNY